MLRKIIESKLGKLTNSEFETLIDLVNDDIRANNLAFGKRTGLAYVVQVAEITLGLIRRYRVVA